MRMKIRRFFSKVKHTIEAYKESAISILGGLITLAISAMFQIHSLWQLDIICVQAVWGNCVDNIVRYQGLLAAGWQHYSDVFPFQDGQFFRMTVGNAYDFFLGMNYVGWCMAIVGTFLIMYGIVLAYKKQLHTLRKNLGIEKDGKVFKHKD